MHSRLGTPDCSASRKFAYETDRLTELSNTQYSVITSSNTKYFGDMRRESER